MRWRIRLTILMIIVLMGCGDLANPMTGAIAGHSPESLDGSEIAHICREHLLDLKYAEHIYYCTFAHEYTDDLDALYDILGVDSLACPSCGSEYLVTIDDDWFRIDCPLGVRPNHGHVTPYTQSWPPPPEEYCEFCRENMSLIATALTMYYSMHGEGYPPELSDLSGILPAIEELECPACGDTYFYETTPGFASYLLRCPMPNWPNHGEVVDGQASWPPAPEEYCDICRSKITNLATALWMYHAMYGNEFPENLSELDESGVYQGADTLGCPACGDVYYYEVGSPADSYLLRCPMDRYPNHGEVNTGIFSW